MANAGAYTGVIIRGAKIALRLSFATLGEAMDWLTSTTTRGASVEIYTTEESMSRLIAFTDYDQDGEVTRYQR
jgi:hypothetical protein